MILFLWFITFIFEAQAKRNKKKGKVKKFIQKEKILTTDTNFLENIKVEDSSNTNKETKESFLECDFCNIIDETVVLKIPELVAIDDLETENCNDAMDIQATNLTNEPNFNFVHDQFFYSQVYIDLHEYIGNLEIEFIFINIIYNRTITLTDIFQLINTGFTFKSLETPEIMNIFIYVGKCIQLRETNIDYSTFYDCYSIIPYKMAFFLKHLQLETKSLLISEFPSIFTLIFKIHNELNIEKTKNISYVSLYYYIKLVESLLVCDVSYFNSQFSVFSGNKIKLYKESDQFIFFREKFFFCIREIFSLVPNFTYQYYVHELCQTVMNNKILNAENNNSEENSSVASIYSIILMTRNRTAKTIYTLIKPESPINTTNIDDISLKIHDLTNFIERSQRGEYRKHLYVNIQLINSYFALFYNYDFFSKYFIRNYDEYQTTIKAIANLRKSLHDSEKICDPCFKKKLVYILKKLSTFYKISVKNIF
ncbi:hypothetical protein CWI37_0099p0020 [Hamiltosporidium tvaerminnensis]|uniref:Uncharacterized protein n=1 Tax=Hamiltosporidium tvaerminnensis TaxID=1176355 RepID=A0A4Q9LB22_9MICR|nr:hypothetical protein LUQ84_3527 [Hamiltosporidium tvaerminnensis]TBU04696.1 hypothetical protein CWI37_0099p0020 [Hamiltosporidium tvaerminnensis]